MYMETSGLSAPGSEAVIKSPIFQVGSFSVYFRTLVSVDNVRFISLFPPKEGRTADHTDMANKNRAHQSAIYFYRALGPSA